MDFENQKVSSSFDGLVFQKTSKLRLNLEFKRINFSFIYGSKSDISESGCISIIRVVVFHLGTVPTAHSPSSSICIVFRILELLETSNWTLVIVGLRHLMQWQSAPFLIKHKLTHFFNKETFFGTRGPLVAIPDICHGSHGYIRVNFFWPV